MRKFEQLPEYGSIPHLSKELPTMSSSVSEELRRRIREKLDKARLERLTCAPQVAPRYDAVFYEGVAWLDSLAKEEERS